MKTRFYVMLGVASLVLAPMVARAATVRKLDTAELAKQSLLIVQGTVVDNKVFSEPGPEGPVNVRTVTTIQVSRTFKGQAKETVTVVGLGGVVGDLSYNWPGVSRFKLGEEAIVFLSRVPAGGLIVPGLQPGDLTVTGLEQGRLTIVDKPGEGKVVTQSFDGLKFSGQAIEIQAPGPKKLVDVVTEIEDLIEAQDAAAEKEGGR